jgi:hypothetical protein
MPVVDGPARSEMKTGRHANHRCQSDRVDPPVDGSSGSIASGQRSRRNPVACDSRHIQQFMVPTSCYLRVCFKRPSSPRFIVSQADMTLLTQMHRPVQRPASLLEWNRWFAWYPVPIVIDGKLHYAWLHTVERKWGTSRYSGTIKWRYRLPGRSRSRKRF